MSKSLFLFSFSLLVLKVHCQFQILNSENNSPVAYAHIKLANKSLGYIADFNGNFPIDSSFKEHDTLLISCIGYQQKAISIEKLKREKVVYLSPKPYQLSEVAITAQKTKYRVRNLGLDKKTGKNGFGFPDYAGTGKNGEEKATWIPNEYSVNGLLKGINIYVTDLGYPDAHFRIHVYNCSAFETKPAEELTHSNIIVSGTTGNEWIHIDMSEEYIPIGENGCFIGIEWFDSPKSHAFKDTVYTEGYTWHNDKQKDTVYSRVRSGNGASIGAIYQSYRKSKNKFWKKEEEGWSNWGNSIEKLLYTTDTFPDGRTMYRTPDNHYQGVLCINIDVAFPKTKIDLPFDAPKKRKLNKIEKEKKDLIQYPQSSINELFSSLIKAFKKEEVVYVLKYLCVYKEDQLEEILDDLDTDEGVLLPPKEKEEIIKQLENIQQQLNDSPLRKLEDQHFELTVNEVVYHLVLEDGLWKINPYSYHITE
jgi:hypothetical protein